MRKYIPSVVAGAVSIPAIIYVGQLHDVWATLGTLGACLLAQILLAIIASLDGRA